MILPDTSVWVDHLRRKDQTLQTQLDERKVLIHPFVIGEVALGHVEHRSEVLLRLHWLPRVMIADTSEVLRFIDRHKLIGTGIGYVDAHLLVSCRLTADALLWTRDKRLLAAAVRLSLAAEF